MMLFIKIFHSVIYMMEKKTGKTMLFLDAKTTGVGSAACGAPLAARYEVRDEEIEMSFDLVLCKR